MKVLSREAPHIRIHIASWDDVFAKLEANSLDLVLSAYQPPANLKAELIAREPFVCLVRTLHAIKTRRLTLERYLSQKHVAAAVDPARERIIDRTLEKLGQKREVQASVPFLSLASIVEATNLIATLPQRSAQRLTQLSRTRIVNAPVEFDKFSYYQIWHPRNDNDPAHQWLRGTIRTRATAHLRRMGPLRFGNRNIHFSLAPHPDRLMGRRRCEDIYVIKNQFFLPSCCRSENDAGGPRACNRGLASRSRGQSDANFVPECSQLEACASSDSIS